MIGEYKLIELCKKYKIHADVLIKKNKNILTYGEYKEMDAILNYLIDELKIDARFIEKCPSILYQNVSKIRRNVEFLKSKNLLLSVIESCLHVLGSSCDLLEETYNYIEKNYGIKAIKHKTSILSVDIKTIMEVEKLNIPFSKKEDNLAIALSIEWKFQTIDNVKNIILSEEFKKYPELFASETLAHATLEEIQKIVASDEFQEHPELFTSQTLARAKFEDVQNIIQSKEYQEYSKLFTSETLSRAKLKDIQKVIQSNEHQEHSDLFTSTTLSHTTLEEVQKIIHSKEYEEHPELFTSTTLAFAKFEDIQRIIHSKEYQEHPELFTSTTLALSNPEEIQNIIQSKEFQEHPGLFTSETLAFAKLEEIKKIIASEEFHLYPELFTSVTLAHAKLEDIQKIIASEEFQLYPKLFTSATLAHAKMEDIQVLLKMEYWNDKRYVDLLTPSIVSRSKIMIKKLPILFELAEYYGISYYLTTNFLLKSPSQNYAVIKFLQENNIPLILGDKLNPILNYYPGTLMKKYNIDIKELMKKYPFKTKGKSI